MRLLAAGQHHAAGEPHHQRCAGHRPARRALGDGVCVQVGRGTSSGSSWEVPVGFEYEEAAGTTAAIAYTVRTGASSGAMRMNGTTGGRLYGGAARTTLMLTELRP